MSSSPELHLMSERQQLETPQPKEEEVLATTPIAEDAPREPETESRAPASDAEAPPTTTVEEEPKPDSPSKKRKYRAKPKAIDAEDSVADIKTAQARKRLRAAPPSPPPLSSASHSPSMPSEEPTPAISLELTEQDRQLAKSLKNRSDQALKDLLLIVEDRQRRQALEAKPSDAPERPEEALSVGDFVFVAKNDYRGVKKPSLGGFGHIVAVCPETNLFTVKYAVDRRKEKEIERKRLTPQTLQALGAGAVDNRPIVKLAMELDNEAPRQLNPLAANTLDNNGAREVEYPVSNFVRRSIRHAGGEQLDRRDVKMLFARLEKNDENDHGLRILRIKNLLEADPNSQVLERLFQLLETSTVVQVLYAQNLEAGMDDARLLQLSNVLKKNKRIWALNVGENFKIRKPAWEAFASALRDTGVTHIYAGSESTVHGPLKERMKDAVRANRSKHTLHNSPSNLDVIANVGQMWWNPRNAKTIKTLYLKGNEVGVGRYVVFKRWEGERVWRWELGRVVRRHPVELMWYLLDVSLHEEEADNESLVWVDFDDAKISACCKYQVRRQVLSREEMTWRPILYFEEPSLLVYAFSPDAQEERIHALRPSVHTLEDWIDVDPLEQDHEKLRAQIERDDASRRE